MEGLKQKIKETIETEPLKELGLKFVGVGADKVVFETPESSRKIVKVSMDILMDKIINLLHGEIEDTESTEKFQQNGVNEQAQYEENIAGVFGSKHLLRKGVFRAKIPLTKEVMLKIVDKKYIPLVEKLDKNKVYEIKMIAETQLIAEELKNKEKFKTKSFNTSLITYDEFRGAEDIQGALSRVRQIVDENFLLECDELFKDEKYKNILKEIVEKIIVYSKKTGFMMDIFGGDNITIFEKEDGSLDYHLLDVVLPGSQKAWGENIKEDEKLHLLRHYYTFYYSIKKVAENLDIKDNLEMDDLIYFKDAEIPTGKFPEEDDFYQHMKNHQ